ncbi:MAG: hypothetical protein OQK51_06490 [Kangiellaceae bacterium]|nr:hypothetical protein [Kangiellaceae bacterium]
MRVIGKEEILSVIDFDEVINAVCESFIDKDSDMIANPTPMQILFHGEENELLADCHVKSAQHMSGKYFVIKVASGFYQNKHTDFPVNNGLSLLFCAQTGQPIVLFNDAGYLTSLRTAAAGALSASLANISGGKAVLGIVGTGHQAKLQAEWICHLINVNEVLVLGRNEASASEFVSRLSLAGVNCRAVHSAKELGKQANIIVTVTPSTSPIIMADDVERPVHIIAIGADSPGKQELDPGILSRAEVIVTDDHEQCLAHGEFGAACRANLVDKHSDVSLGKILSGKLPNPISGNGISIIDLTGLSAQDLAIATCLWAKIN